MSTEVDQLFIAAGYEQQECSQMHPSFVVYFAMKIWQLGSLSHRLRYDETV